ncbi:MAG: nitrate- and nitrite sensing domain-containing protein [Acidimicrobiia bacterium]
MFRRIPIRRKLAGALAIPLTALIVVAVLEVIQSQREADQVREQAALATASIGPNGLITALMNERNFSAVWLLGFAESGALELPVDSNEQARQETDQALELFTDEVLTEGGDVERTYRPALEELEALAALRTATDDYPGVRQLAESIDYSDMIFDGYTDLIHGLFEANSQVALAVDDAELRRAVELSDLASRQIDTYALLTSELLVGQLANSDLPAPIHEPAVNSTASDLYGQALRNLEDIRSLGTGRFQQATDRLMEESESLGFIPTAGRSIEEGVVPIGDLTASVSNESTDFSHYGFRTRVGDLLEERAGELTSAAANRERWFLALAGLALFVAVAVTWIVSRSITRPLRSLTSQAKDMAEERLPEAVLDILETPLGEDVEVPQVEPIEVHTRDEVADVAEALNTVQDSALDLAVEQAVLRRNIADSFVNLGRRNQNLLGRQLDFITELESNETDPETLADLFRLDHLATRMRRNAESLLVLAGIDPPRKWVAPVRLTDVIRAALGEVEDYQRVTVRGVEPATVLGAVAADLAHLLAELIENALVFSPPDQPVDIRGRSRPDGGYTLAIIDSGLGMTPDDIAAANRRLAGVESFTIAPSKYLGHYVAGNLAARHGIAVHLAESPGNGVTAMVDLPPVLLTSDTPVADQLPAGAVQAAPAAAMPPPAPMLPPPSTGQVQAVPAGVVAPGAANPTAGSGPVPPFGPVGDQPRYNGPVSDGGPMLPGGPAAASRTPSGLVKRTPRAGSTSPAPMPEGTLLASLSQVTQNLPGAGAGRPPGPAGAPGPVGGPEPWTTPRPRRPEPGPPLVADPAIRVRGGAPGSPQPDGADLLGAAGPSGPDGPEGGDRTRSGLERRVRGAQLPSTQPLSVRRTGEHRAVPGGDYGHGRQPVGHGDDSATGGANGSASISTTQDDSSARNVYSFLTSFTAGVQRGLDESRRGPTTPEEDS